MIDRAIDLFKRFVGAVGAPIREFYLAVGHSTVAAAVILSAGGLVALVTWQSFVAELQGPAWRALEIERQSRAAVYDRQLESSPTRPADAWILCAIEADGEGVTLSFPPIPAAEFLFIQWQAKDGNGGIRAYSIPSPLPQIAAIRAPRTDFGASWASGTEISLSLVQRTSSGEQAPFLGTPPTFMVPP